MNNDLTELVVVIDKSGSMNSVRDDAIGGFNSFLKDQQEAPGQANMTVVLFDTFYKFYAADMDVKKVTPLDRKSYAPDGCTALYDAVCIAIDKIGEKLASKKEEERPGKIIFAILTDGAENSSKTFTREDTFKRIALQRDTYKWEFVFLAAGQDAFEAGRSIGMDISKMAMFTAKDVDASYNAVSSYATSLRSAKSADEYVNLTSSINLQSAVDAAINIKEAKTAN